MPKIIHAADFHLDSAFGGLPPEKSRERRRESRELTDRLAALAEAEGVELALLSGDLFDGKRVYPETLERLRAALGRMKCPVFIAPGNHDPFTPDSPYARMVWPENVHIFSQGRMDAIVLPDLGCVVHGAAFVGPERTDQVLEGYTVPQDGLIHMVCLHADVFGKDSRYGPVTREQIARSGAAYLALGHVHQCSGLQHQGEVRWAYPGCPEGRGFDELEDKGVLVGEVGPEGVSVRFTPLCKRRYRVLTADVTGTDPRSALEAIMPESAAQDICRVVFTGEIDGPGVDLAALEGMFRERFYDLELRDHTRPAQSLWERAGEDSLRGLFLHELRERYEAAGTEQEREQIVRAVRFGLAALDGRDLG